MEGRQKSRYPGQSLSQKSRLCPNGWILVKEQELNVIKSGGIRYKEADIHEVSVKQNCRWKLRSLINSYSFEPRPATGYWGKWKLRAMCNQQHCLQTGSVHPRALQWSFYRRKEIINEQDLSRSILIWRQKADCFSANKLRKKSGFRIKTKNYFSTENKCVIFHQSD